MFHALPIPQGKSIVNSHWIKDMIGFLNSLLVSMCQAAMSMACSTATMAFMGPRVEASRRYFAEK